MQLPFFSVDLALFLFIAFNTIMTVDAGIEPRTVAVYALTTAPNLWATYHPRTYICTCAANDIGLEFVFSATQTHCK